MRVLMLSTDRKIFDEGSAVQKRMKEYGTLFDELHIIVFSPRAHKKKTTQLSRNTWVYPTNSSSRWLYVRDAARVARQLGEVDVVTAQDPFEVGFAGYLIAKRRQVPLQLQLHANPWSPYFRGMLNTVRRVLAGFVLPRASRIRVVSEELKRHIELRHPEVAGQIDVLPIYTDAKKLEQAPIQTDLHKKNPQWDFILLMVSRLVPEKDIATALRALRRVVKVYPRVGLVIAGDGEEKKKLTSLVEGYQLSDNVAFLGWQDNVATLYKTADVFLLTSLHEGHAMTVVEAAVCGLPTLATPVGLVASLPKDIQRRITCPAGDDACFAKKITAFCESDGDRVYFKSHVRDVILRSVHTDKETYLETFKKVLEQCIHKRGEKQ